MESADNSASQSDSEKKTRGLRGRPPVFDRTKREVVVALVSVGCTRTYAARYLGVSPQTVLNTAARDTDFAVRIEQAAANLQMDHLRTVSTASRRSWHASAWLLERIAPDRFANPHSRSARRQILKRFRKAIFAILEEEIDESSLRERLVKRIQQAFVKTA